MWEHGPVLLRRRVMSDQRPQAGAVVENAGKETTKTALQASRSSHPERLTHEQSQIQRPKTTFTTGS